MAKLWLLAACAAVIYVYFSYPLYSENVSYAIVLVCFAVIVFSGLSIIYSKEKEETYEEVEKANDRIYSENGIFRYATDGFYIAKKQETDFLKWNDILEINAHRIPVFKDFQYAIEIITAEKRFQFEDSNTRGFEKLKLQINENLPIDDRSWTLMNSFNPDKTIRKNSILTETVYRKPNQ